MEHIKPTIKKLLLQYRIMLIEALDKFYDANGDLVINDQNIDLIDALDEVDDILQLEGGENGNER